VQKLFAESYAKIWQFMTRGLLQVYFSGWMPPAEKLPKEMRILF
jgi:hypothetical protein